MVGVNSPSTNKYLLRRIGAEETSVARLAVLLRWCFLNNGKGVSELQELESALGRQGADIYSHARLPKDTEVRDA